MIEAVIPTLNAARTLPQTLAALAASSGSTTSPISHMIVCDGGSDDETLSIAASSGAVVVTSDRGRGHQMAHGAEVAIARGASWLLFLHADCTPSMGWQDELHRFIAETQNAQRAGVFRFALDDTRPVARQLERIVRWRCRWLALPYGDQGLLINASFYRALGGFRPIPLMEDVDIVRRIGRRRLTFFETPLISSAERYRKGYGRRMLRNAFCLTLYYIGIPPGLIARLYG